MKTPFNIDPDGVYTTDDIADILKYDRQVVIKHIKDGYLSAYKINRVYRIAGDDLIKFLQKHRIEAV